ncbi:MAG: GIY-YIG nuclease family protein [Bacillota bacterium]
METRKELKQKYKEMKTPMGAVIIKNTINNKAFIDVSTDIKSIINRHRFQLTMGVHRIKELQRDWREYGEEAFVFEVLESLEYDEKEEKTDYTEELTILKMIWIEKLSKNDSMQLYEK